MHYNIFDIL